MTDVEKYVIARWAYSVGEPIMDDASYTILDRMFRQRFPNSPLCSRSWSSDDCPVYLLRLYNYEHLIKPVVLSDKTESIPSLNSLIEVRSVYKTMNTPHRLSFKLDGWNIQASYYRGALVHIQTRGRSSDAMDANVLEPLFPKNIPLMGKVLITSELIIPNEDFEWFKSTYGSTSQRGTCSTALAHGGEDLKHIKVLAHGIRCEQYIDPVDKLPMLTSMGFEVPDSVVVNNYDDLMKQVDILTDKKNIYPYPTDGLVCDGNNMVRAIRIKGWEEPIYKSYVQGYTQHYGPHAISIQLNIFPIKLQNSTQRQLPATNIARIMSMKLMPGAPVAFRIASSAIADIDEEATRLLQQEWEGREHEYQFMIEANENLK